MFVLAADRTEASIRLNDPRQSFIVLVLVIDIHRVAAASRCPSSLSCSKMQSARATSGSIRRDFLQQSGRPTWQTPLYAVALGKDLAVALY